MLALIVGVKMNVVRLQLIKLAARVAFLASFLHIFIIDTLNSMIDQLFSSLHLLFMHLTYLDTEAL